MVLEGIKITHFYRELNEQNWSSKKGPELCESSREQTCHMSEGKCTYSFACAWTRTNVSAFLVLTYVFADSYICDFEKLSLVAIRTPFFDSGCGGNLEMRTALFWVIIAQQVVVISNRRFRTTFRSHAQGFFFFLILEPWGWDRSDESKDSFYEELEQVFDHFPKYHMKMLVGDFNAKVGRENIFKPTTGPESLHQDSNDNGVRTVKLGHIKKPGC